MNKKICMTLLAAALCMAGGATVAVAQEAMPAMPHPAPTQTGNTAQVSGTLHGIDTAKRTLNIEHPAVPEFKWPAMRMDFSVANDIKLDDLKPGQLLHFTLTKSDQGSFSITQIMAAP